MKELIERFYDSIRLNAPPPIPYREILLTARIMDEIFGQVYPSRNNGYVQTEVKQPTTDYTDVADRSVICPPISVI